MKNVEVLPKTAALESEKLARLWTVLHGPAHQLAMRMCTVSFALAHLLVCCVPEKVGHDHVMRTIIEIPSDSSIHFLRRETRPFFTGCSEGILLKL